MGSIRDLETFPSNPDQRTFSLGSRTEVSLLLFVASQRKPEDEKNIGISKQKSFSKTQKGNRLFSLKANASYEKSHQNREGKMRLSTIFLWTLKNSSENNKVKIQWSYGKI